MKEKNININKNNHISKTKTLFFYFLIYSFCGWILETIYAFITLGHFVKRGFLLGPICPIYGFSAVILIILFKNKKENLLKIFLKGSILFSVFEYLVSFILEALFANRWWDYNNEIYNLNGRVSLIYALYWGIAVIIFIKHLHPYISNKINKLLNKIPTNILNLLYQFLFLLIIFDTFLSSLRYLVNI